MPDRTAALNLAVGLVEFALVPTLIHRGVRLGRDRTWLVMLATFFALRGSERVAAASQGDAAREIWTVIDGALAFSLLLLLVATAAATRALRLVWSDRSLDREYRRALADYRRLVHHRLANPTTAIIGATQALKELPIDVRAQRELLEIIGHEAARLRAISLDPEECRPDERGLHPQPQPAPPECRYRRPDL
jgi:signal transduction histidine kinase